jgi:hypothetical protein
MKFPVDAPRNGVVKALQTLGFQIVREREHIAMRRTNPDGSTTPLTLPIGKASHTDAMTNDTDSCPIVGDSRTR